jgi:peptide/nickel transport system substrate-binding protein
MTTRASITRRGFAGTAAGAALFTGGLSARPARADSGGGTVVVGHSGFRHLNPAIQSGSGTGVPGCQIFAGLIELDDKFVPQPYLAKSWEISADQLTCTFHLVEDAIFHDGKPVTAEDVAFSLGIVKANHPFGPSMFEAVERVDAPDPHTAVIHLSHPHPALMASLSPVLMPVLPKHVFGEGPIETNPANLAPIGSGPFKFVEYHPGEQVILGRNEQFFRKGKPYIDRLVFKIVTDPMATLLALERGEIHYLPLANVPLRDLKRVTANPALALTKSGYEAYGAVSYLEFNLRQPPLDDVRVRKAIAHAIDKNFIVNQLLSGQTIVLDGPLVKASPFHSDDLVRYPLDLDLANRMLDEAGHPRNADGTRFSFTLDWLPGDVNSQEPTAQYLKPQLKKIGIDISLRASPDFATWANRVSSWDYQLTMNGIWNYPDPVIGTHRAFLSTNRRKGVIWSNTEGYSNPKVDAVLEAAAREGDLAKRKALYAEFQKIVTDDLPFVWTIEAPLFTIYDKKLTGIPLSVWGPLAPFDEMRWQT